MTRRCIPPSTMPSDCAPRTSGSEHCPASPTSYGRGGPDRIADLIGIFVRITGGAPWDTIGLEPVQLCHAALDLRAYYEEAALALAGHTPAARKAESWFYRSTATGTLLREAQAILRAADAPRPAWFPLVPVGQPAT